jgi:hypothetical protein
MGPGAGDAGRLLPAWGHHERKQDVIMAAQPTPEAPRQSRLVRIQYAAITAMKNDMRSAMPAMVAIMVE